MALFEPMEVTWKGETKEVPPGRVMQILANLEESITFAEANELLFTVLQTGSRKQMRVVNTYHSFLRSCGFRVELEEVYEIMDVSGYVSALNELINVLKLTLPPDERRKYEQALAGEADETPEQEQPEAKKPKPGE